MKLIFNHRQHFLFKLFLAQLFLVKFAVAGLIVNEQACRDGPAPCRIYYRAKQVGIGFS